MAPVRTAVPSFLDLAAHPVRWKLLSALATTDLRVKELTSLASESQNLVSYHLRMLRDGGFVQTHRSTFDGRDTYYHLDLDRCEQAMAEAGGALHPTLRMTPPTLHRDGSRWNRQLSVLFMCSGNSARSLIAEALLRQTTSGVVTVESAGNTPKPSAHPLALQLLNERYDIDISGRLPRHVETLKGRHFDYVVTLCDRAREACPDFDGRARRMHWSLADPSSDRKTNRERRSAFERTATEIEARIRHLLAFLITTPEVQS